MCFFGVLKHMQKNPICWRQALQAPEDNMHQWYSSHSSVHVDSGRGLFYEVFLSVLVKTAPSSWPHSSHGRTGHP